MAGKPTDGFTGKQLEDDFLFSPGQAVWRPARREEVIELEIREAILECLSHRNPNRYSLEQLSNPPARWMNDVHAIVADQLGLGEEEYERLKVFPAVSTSADLHHGIDAFFIYTPKGTKQSVIVTLDFTTVLENKMVIAPGEANAKMAFQADILVTPDRAMPQPGKYGELRPYSLPDVEKANKNEQLRRAMARKEELAKMINGIIQHKLRRGDPNYRELMKKFDVDNLLKAQKGP